jgi:hypothetical protein
MQHILGSIWARKKAGPQIETYAFAAAALAALSVGAPAATIACPQNSSTTGAWPSLPPTIWHSTDVVAARVPTTLAIG